MIKNVDCILIYSVYIYLCVYSHLVFHVYGSGSLGSLDHIVARCPHIDRDIYTKLHKFTLRDGM